MNNAVKQKRTIPQEILQAGDGMLSPYGLSLTELLKQEKGGNHKQEPEGKLMLTYREAARMLGISKDTVRRYIQSGILRGEKNEPPPQRGIPDIPVLNPGVSPELRSQCGERS